MMLEEMSTNLGINLRLDRNSFAIAGTRWILVLPCALFLLDGRSSVTRLALLLGATARPGRLALLELFHELQRTDFGGLHVVQILPHFAELQLGLFDLPLVPGIKDENVYAIGSILDS